VPATIENLKTAFAGESQANRKYLAFARRAEKDGYPKSPSYSAPLPRPRPSMPSPICRTLGGVASTLENLQAAIAGETYEYREMYPPMVEQARARTQGQDPCWTTPTRSNAYTRNSTASPSRLAGGQGSGRMDVYLCPVCGHLGIRQAAEKCPICGLPAAKVSEDELEIHRQITAFGTIAKTAVQPVPLVGCGQAGEIVIFDAAVEVDLVAHAPDAPGGDVVANRVCFAPSPWPNQRNTPSR